MSVLKSKKSPVHYKVSLMSRNKQFSVIRRQGGGSPLPGITRSQKGSGGLRLLKVGEEIRRVLSDIFTSYTFDRPDLAHQIISITEVRVSPDLRHAFVYMIPLNVENQDIKPIVEALVQESSHLRYMLAQKIQLRYTPQLHFEKDTRFERGSLIDALLKKTRMSHTE